MKNGFWKKILAMLIVLTVLCTSACGGETPIIQTPPQQEDETTDIYPENGTEKIISVEKLLYVAPEVSEPVNVAYYESTPEILLVEITSAVSEFINEFLLGRSENTKVEIKETDTTITLTRENGAYCEIDCVADTVYFSDFETFHINHYQANPHDALAYEYINEDGESIFLKRETSFFTPGYDIEIYLAERNIPLDIYEGKKYIPLQTFNDLFITSYGYNVANNGQDLFLLVGTTLHAGLEDLYYFDEPTMRSSKLTEFNYNELCLYLDLYYGLQFEHGFYTGFDDLLESIGLKEQMLEADSVESFNAIASLTLGYIADAHSNAVAASPYAGSKKPESVVRPVMAPGIEQYMKDASRYTQARAEALGEVQFYQKVGNTAYITFDSFALGDRSTGYEGALTIGDTVDIVIASHARITQDPEIENVVVDLSCNGGGAFDAAVYLIAWMIGSCDLSIYNGITGSRSTTTYKADVNLDGVFDENDTISSKNLYCIISPTSFSCGNLVPALLKASGEVTIVGKMSSGGGCIVKHALTADGTLFCISSTSQLSIVKNGTYYSIDQGVEPDVSLTKIESFYDRVALTEYLNGLK